jgi:hypothetical protein
MFENTDIASVNPVVFVSDVTSVGFNFYGGGIFSQTPLNVVSTVFAGPTAIKGVAGPNNTVGQNGGWGVQGTSNAGFGVGGLTSIGVALYGHALNAAGYALQTTGKLRFNGQNAAANRVLSSINAFGDAIWQDLSAIGGVSGSGTLNFIPKWTPNGTTLGNSQIFDNGFGVGIGTTTPVFSLDIASTVAVEQLIDTDNGTVFGIAAPGFGYTGGVGTVSNHDLAIFSNNLDRMTVKITDG